MPDPSDSERVTMWRWTDFPNSSWHAPPPEKSREAFFRWVRENAVEVRTFAPVSDQSETDDSRSRDEVSVSDQSDAEVERLREALEKLRDEKRRQLPEAPRGPGAEGGYRYDLTRSLNQAMNHLRDAEDRARIEAPAWPTADRIRSIHEQLTEDVLNGKTSIPPVLERLQTAEAQLNASIGETLSARRKRDEAEAQLARAKEERDEARLRMTQLAREKGEAQGKLEASEWPGIVDGWKARAETAEAQLEDALDSLDRQRAAHDEERERADRAEARLARVEKERDRKTHIEGITSQGIEDFQAQMDRLGIPRESYEAQAGGVCEWTFWGRITEALNRSEGVTGGRSAGKSDCGEADSELFAAPDQSDGGVGLSRYCRGLIEARRDARLRAR